MEKYIVGLFGARESGKTTSLKAFIQKLKDDLAFRFIDEEPREDNDVVAIFEHLEKRIKIGISTAGDIADLIQNNVEEYLIKEHQCQIIFTASRTKGETVGKLCNLEKMYQYKLNWIQKLYRTHDPIKEKSIHFDNVTKHEVQYLRDYLLELLYQ